ncbi:helix-turn-helix transcriptional regulator [Antarcticimicrobium sediminis]|uniref:LuxR family transcriptional regulator n=1 Tax=Antarcticimicrobium sediminis TaxID=2546227 RepID=A0A4R5EZY2_9RHOB|nr:LuxR C-terminal-related transcriptional regulator [Antarcticimicrobium sediminis]TDE40674.1 LuxR family transcriptional regulator [Antarcticimicrobium sediminis]
MKFTTRICFLQGARGFLRLRVVPLKSSIPRAKGVFAMKNFRERGEIHFRRSEFSKQFCVGANIPMVLMAFFDGQTGALIENWIGQRNGASKDCVQSMKKTTQAQLAVWAAMKAKRQPGTERDPAPEGSDSAPILLETKEHIIGIGAPANGIYPVLALPRGSDQDLRARNALMRIGLAYVSQQVNEEMFERSAWMEGVVDAAMQVLSIQFLVVTADGEIQFDSRQNQPRDGKCGWLVCNGHLALNSDHANAELHEAIRAATSPERRTSIVSVFTAPGVARLLVVTPLASQDVTMAMVLFENEQTDHFKLREHFFNAYGLTRSESQIAHEILGGRSIAEAAKTRNLSPATVRSYMKQVFSKTGTHRQGELISLYFSSILPLTAGPNAPGGVHLQ